MARPKYECTQTVPHSVERYFAVHSELLLFLTPHAHRQYQAYVKEVLPVFSILFCSTSRSDPTTLHIDFIAEGQPAALPYQFTISIGELPPLSNNFETKVESIIAAQSTSGLSPGDLAQARPVTTVSSVASGRQKTPLLLIDNVKTDRDDAKDNILRRYGLSNCCFLHCSFSKLAFLAPVVPLIP